MDEVTVHNIKMRHEALFELEKRKEYILQTIRDREALTPELEARIEETLDSTVLEDIFLPYKPKRNTRAQAARALGLEPLAKMIMSQSSNSQPEALAAKFVKGDVKDESEALAGAMDIIAEWVSESEKARNIVRARYQRSATINAKVVPGKEAEGDKYRNYFDFSEPLRMCNSHRYLAIRRAEEEGILRVSISIEDDDMMDRLNRMFVRPTASVPLAEIVKTAVKDGYRRLMRPSIENEIAGVTKEKATPEPYRCLLTMFVSFLCPRRSAAKESWLLTPATARVARSWLLMSKAICCIMMWSTPLRRPMISLEPVTRCVTWSTTIALTRLQSAPAPVAVRLNDSFAMSYSRDGCRYLWSTSMEPRYIRHPKWPERNFPTRMLLCVVPYLSDADCLTRWPNL